MSLHFQNFLWIPTVEVHPLKLTGVVRTIPLRKRKVQRIAMTSVRLGRNWGAKSSIAVIIVSTIAN